MCNCTPEIKTPWCGKPGCEMPEQVKPKPSPKLHGWGVEMIAAERERQISKEGWDASRDDDYIFDDLAVAASCYAQPDYKRVYWELDGISQSPKDWPWEDSWWKPSKDATADGRLRELAKAGALIAAEIDRIMRCKEASHD